MADLNDICSISTDIADYPNASCLDNGVVTYESAHVVAMAATYIGRRAVQSELAMALGDGPGVVIFRNAFPDRSVVDRATIEFQKMVDDQHHSGAQSGDHFAKPGGNDRVWNALERLAVQAPEVFVDYYRNDILAIVSEAWLGPNYQITSQLNVVNPGGEAQKPHRDYHLGFLTQPVAERFPSQVHAMSPLLTLQGAVAHCDMPIETGPTMYLPHSHKYLFGYVAWRLPEFENYFAKNFVQVPLQNGDVAFFNPAVLHGAGTNLTPNTRRMANLLQVSSAFGRAMESVDRYRMIDAIYPALLDAQQRGFTPRDVDNVVAASAEGYAFPTNLDFDPPVGGLTPDAQSDVVRRALDQRWSPAELAAELNKHRVRRFSM